jgi:hypothetical protein
VCVCVCVCTCVALVIQHAKLLRSIIFSSVSFPALPNLSKLSQKFSTFEKNVNVKSVFFLFSLQMLSGKNLSFKNNSARLYEKRTSSCKVPSILVRF